MYTRLKEVMEHGIEQGPFKKFKKVLSGHFHTKSTKDNIHYLGNPYELYWNDYQASRGFHILDTDTLDLKFYKNPYNMFEKIYYNDVDKLINPNNFTNKYVKLIVEKRENQILFDNTVKMLYDAGVADLKIIEDATLEFEGISDDIETEDTLTLLDKYVDEVEYSVDKQSIKTTIKSLYLEACEF